ncbi:hypothetical protein B0A54_01295 [Friedmanniomyces endolithicus]|uniref:Mid2 domain-containing protein n=1 Tax=Friedmanniomyces endolithicus TaxID=329885 RepID=A0A4U0VJ75_9PEZI|nr:hypothetical protein B0A54_01295 [Friedmanniomyces endolithicus]
MHTNLPAGIQFNAYGVLLAQVILTTNSTRAPPSTLASTTTASPSSQTQSNATATSSQANSDSTTTATGLTPGAKAGLAIGIIAGCGALASILWFVFRAGRRGGTADRPLHDSEHRAELPDKDSEAGPRLPHELLVEDKTAELGSSERHELSTEETPAELGPSGPYEISSKFQSPWSIDGH